MRSTPSRSWTALLRAADLLVDEGEVVARGRQAAGVACGLEGRACLFENADCIGILRLPPQNAAQVALDVGGGGGVVGGGVELEGGSEGALRLGQAPQLGPGQPQVGGGAGGQQRVVGVAGGLEGAGEEGLGAAGVSLVEQQQPELDVRLGPRQRVVRAAREGLGLLQVGASVGAAAEPLVDDAQGLLTAGLAGQVLGGAEAAQRERELHHGLGGLPLLEQRETALHLCGGGVGGLVRPGPSRREGEQGGDDDGARGSRGGGGPWAQISMLASWVRASSSEGSSSMARSRASRARVTSWRSR